MKRKEVKIHSADGISARAAALLVQEACKFEARVLIEQGSKVINAKSLMGVLSLNISGGDPLYLVLSGEDEDEALDAMVRLLRADFIATA
jgi:phosphotransferase system HPr (HPr) family protein